MEAMIERLKSLPGKTGFFYKNLETGETINWNENEKFIPASVIKLPVMMAIFKMAERGEADLYEKIRIRHEQKMPSCGALNSFTDEPEIDILTLCSLMITISDNTATNVLISHFGTEKLNRKFAQMGLEDTRVNRLLFDMEASKKGIQNCATPKETAFLLEELHCGRFVSEKVSEAIKEILLRQQINHKIKEKLPPGTRAAHKTGEDDYISNDAGIIYASQPFIFSFFSNDTKVSEVNSFMRDAAAELFERCSEGR